MLNFKDLQYGALSKIEFLLDTLKIEWVQRHKDYINIICPVHESTDLSSSCIYLSNGTYKCWSRGCDNTVGPNFIHLIKWALSQNGEISSWNDVATLVSGSDGYNCEIKDRIRHEYIEGPIPLMDPCKYPSVTIPSKYYIDRGFSPEVLIKYGVGDTTQFPYANRSLVPVKTEDGALMGFSGRSQNDECPKCSFYHSKYETCISKDYEYAHMFNKWFHSGGMKKMRTLYGISEVSGTNKIAIVEGPSCVWKLYEVGIPAAAVLGKSFSGEQANILKRKGIIHVFLLSDEDEGGKEFKQNFIENWHTVFNILTTKLPKKDIGEMTDEEIIELKRKWDKI